MNPLLYYLLYLASLLVPAVVGFAMINRILREYRPMLFYAWAILALEITQTFLPLDSPVRLVSANLQYLLEILLVIWLASSWKAFDGVRWLIPALITLVIGAWTIEKFVNGWDAPLSWVRAGFSFLSAVLAIEFMGRTMIKRSGQLLRNGMFLFSLGIALKYIMFTVIEVLLFASKLEGERLLTQLFYFSIITGIITNLIILTAYLCLPTRTRFSFR
jgi:hypothetical protein